MRLIALLLFLLAALPTQAQQFNFRNWSLEQGLPQSQVNDVVQDLEGQLWVATLGGLSRFDGSTFQTYTKREGLSSNSLKCLLLDKERNLWIGTHDKGLMRLKGNSFQVYDMEAGLPAGGVHNIAEDSQGIIWAATDSGVYYLSGSRFSRYTRLPKQHFTDLLFTKTNDLWAASHADGLYLVRAAGSAHYTKTNSALPHNSVNVLSATPNGTIWVGTAQGIATVQDQQLYAFNLPAGLSNSDVTDFTTDGYGHQWISLRNRGIVRYNGEDFQHLTRYNGLRSDKTNSITTDREGNMWIGTSGHGLMQYRSPWFVHYFDMGEVKEPVITALAKDAQGKVWLGTDDGHAAYLQEGIINWLQTTLWPQGSSLYGMWVTHENDVWVSTSQGLYRLGPQKATHYGTDQGLPANEVYQVLPDSLGNLLIATAAGLASLQKGAATARAIHKPQRTGKVHVLHTDQSGRVWLGTEKGVFYYEDGIIKAARPLGEAGFREIQAIAEDRQGILYFGGFNYGIMAWHPNWQEPKIYNSNNGLPNEGIKCLYVDKSNHLWIGTSRGVHKMRLNDMQERGRLRIRSYDNQEGFRGLEVSNRGITQTDDGTVWFATARGLTMYLPDLDRRHQVYPTVVLTGIMLSLKPTDWQLLGYNTDSLSGLPINLTLAPHQNHVTFDFNGILLSAPDRVRYRYRLQGHEDNWSAVTEHSFATYASLAPGTYTFQLLASNSEGYWSPSPLTYTFSIRPPLWRREWFIVLLVLATMVGTLSVVRLRERSLLNLTAMLEQKVQHRTQLLEEKNREKETLLKEIHHRVKNNLQIVMSMLNLQARRVSDPSAQEVMQAVKARVRSMAILHERLYQHEDLASIDLSAYIQEICQGLCDTYGTKERNIKLVLNIPSIMVEADTALSLGLIANELVSNAIKYAFPDRQGFIAISLVREYANNYTLTVHDNGLGLPPDFEARQKKSFGLQLVHSLARKLGGSMEFINNNGTNSILHFVLAS